MPSVEGAASPELLIKEILTRFEQGDSAAFARTYPFEDGRGLVTEAARGGWDLHPGIGRVAWKDDDRAGLVLSGHPIFPWDGRSSERETWQTLGFSGLYEARRIDARWVLQRRIPLDQGVQLLTQNLEARLRPGVELGVRALVEARVESPWGLALRLNHSALIGAVTVDGEPADHGAGGGLVWIPPPREGRRVQLTLSYSLDLTSEPARFTPKYGHVRGQFFWHPVLGFATPAAFADFRVEVRSPEATQVLLDLPQSVDVENGERVVTSVGTHPVRSTGFLYDEDWNPRSLTFDSVRLSLHVTSDFEPGTERVFATFERIHRFLSQRFGEPPWTNLVIGQQRALDRAVWMWNHNRMLGAGVSGGPLFTRGPRPQAPFAHEVAHWWLPGVTGPAADFLSEAWAMYAESLLLENEFGPEVERDFFAFWRNVYVTRGTDGEASLLEVNPENRTPAYSKGVWILRMIRDHLGTETFRAGLRRFMSIPLGAPAGVEELYEAFSTVAGEDIRPFLRPWLEERSIPDVVASLEGGSVVVRHRGPLYPLRLELGLDGPTGSRIDTVELTGREARLPVEVGEVTDVVVDPRRRLLIRRHRGEIVTFRLEAPEAEEVKLYGDFTAEGLLAVPDGAGSWQISLPMTAGRYYYVWTVDGGVAGSGARVVEPLVALEEAFPKP